MNEFELWQRNELRILRAIARLTGAWLQEPDDKAMKEVPTQIREALRELYIHKQSGRERGWQ